MKKMFMAIVLVSIFFWGTSAWAHKVNVFCYRDGLTLRGEAYFSGGRPAQESTVEIYRLSDNQLLGTLISDAQGGFSFELAEDAAVRVVVIAGQGHRNEYVLQAEKQASAVQQAVSQETKSGTCVCDCDEETRTLRERIMHLEKELSEPSLVDIFGGIGWIIGIFCLLYLVKNRKHSAS